MSISREAASTAISNGIKASAERQTNIARGFQLSRLRQRDLAEERSTPYHVEEPIEEPVDKSADYMSVINGLDVTTNKRYKPGEYTYCNVFVLDAAKALGAEIPNGNANSIGKWLGKAGSDAGWQEVSGEDAQKRANEGYLTVSSWINPDPMKSGHVQLIIPGEYDSRNGPTAAQAGTNNWIGKGARYGFSSDKWPSVKYYSYGS